MPRIGLYPDAGKSRIRSNKTIQSLIQKNAAELRNMLICHIRSHFHKNGHMATRFRSQVGLLRFQGSQQTGSGFRRLKVAQAWRIGRREINGYIIRHRPGRTQTSKVILGGILIGSYFIFPNIDTQNTVKTSGGTNVFHSGGNTFIVKSHPVDNSFLGNQPEQAGLFIARLRPGRQRTHFHKTESGLAKSAYRIRFLVHSGGKSHPVGEFHPQDFHRIRRNFPHY